MTCLKKTNKQTSEGFRDRSTKETDERGVKDHFSFIQMHIPTYTPSQTHSNISETTNTDNRKSHSFKKIAKRFFVHDHVCRRVRRPRPAAFTRVLSFKATVGAFIKTHGHSSSNKMAPFFFSKINKTDIKEIRLE